MGKPPPQIKPGMTPEEVTDLHDSLRDADRFIEERMPAKPSHKEVSDDLLDALEVGIGATAFGFLAGFTGTTSIGPVPVGLGAAGAYYVAAAMGYVPKSWSRHAGNVIAKGGLAGYGALWGAGQGLLLSQRMQENKAGAERKPAAAGIAGLSRLSPRSRPAPGAAGIAGQAPAPAHAALPTGAAGPPLGYHLNEAELQAIRQKQRK